MKLALQNPFLLSRTNLAWSSQRASVATSVTVPIRRQTEVIRTGTHSFSVATSQRPAASLFVGSGRLFIPASFETPINTHRAGIVPRFSPIHF